MSPGEQFRETIERMEDHEILERIRLEQFGDEALAVARSILASRGTASTPGSPAAEVHSNDDAPSKRAAEPSKLFAVMYGALGGVLAGGPLGAALAGAIGAGVVGALVGWLGYRFGDVIAQRVHRIDDDLYRQSAHGAAVIVWLLVCSLIGLIVRLMSR